MEKSVLSKEEINNLSSLQQQQDNFIIQLGQIEYQIQTLELDKDSLTESLSQLRKDQVTLGQQMTEKYGDGNVNLDTGEFTKV